MKKQNRKTEVPDRFRLLSWIGDLFKGLLTGSARRKVVVTLMGVVVFVTTYALILPALTLEESETAQVPGFHLGDIITNETSARNIERAIEEASSSGESDTGTPAAEEADTGKDENGSSESGSAADTAGTEEETAVNRSSGEVTKTAGDGSGAAGRRVFVERKTEGQTGNDAETETVTGDVEPEQETAAEEPEDSSQVDKEAEGENASGKEHEDKAAAASDKKKTVRLLEEEETEDSPGAKENASSDGKTAEEGSERTGTENRPQNNEADTEADSGEGKDNGTTEPSEEKAGKVTGDASGKAEKTDGLPESDTEERGTAADSGPGSASGKEAGTGGRKVVKMTDEDEESAEKETADGTDNNDTGEEEGNATGEEAGETGADQETGGEEKAGRKGEGPEDGGQSAGEDAADENGIEDDTVYVPFDMTYEGFDYTIHVSGDESARIPEDAVLSVREITQNSSEYYVYASFVSNEMDGEQASIIGSRFFDISFLVDGQEIEPNAAVNVEITFEEAQDVEPDQNLSVVHFNNSDTEILENDPTVTDGGMESIRFETDRFSVYGIIGSIIEKSILASDGHNYRVSVTYGKDAGVPEGAALAVDEVTMETEGMALPYEEYISWSESALGLEEGSASYVRLFDIRILDGAGEKVALQAPVEVRVRLEDKETGTDPTQVVHFPEKQEEREAPEVLDRVGVNGDTVSFRTEGFSVYAIIEAPEPVASTGWNLVSSLEEIAKLGSDGFYVRHPDGYYFTSEQSKINSTRTGIRKTKPAAASPDQAQNQSAALYHFESVEGTPDQFKVWCDNSNTKKYIKQSTNSLSLVSENEATVFTISAFPGRENTFRMLGSGGFYWNMRGGASGNEFAAYNDETDANARIQLLYYSLQEDDPYQLNGKTCGIAYQDESVTAAALTTEAKTVGGIQRLAGKDLLMRPDVLDHDGVLLVAANSDIAEWTFESVREDKYYLSTTVGGKKKYLTMNGNHVTLEDEPDELHSLLKATPGTGANKGKWHFSAGTYSLSLQGSAGNGFQAVAGSAASTWMNLVEKSVLTEDDFNLYTAKKVSVSDMENVYNGQQVVIYTRIWNENTKRYEFFSVDHDGSLIHCYDTGDNVEWIGSKVNTALWDFTEYKNSDGTPNYYYELQNSQYRNCLAPQLTGGQILSNRTIGINLNGRRYGENYSTIIAWDDANYAYAGLKTEQGHIAACPLSEAEDFYFAVVNPVDTDDQLTEVQTVDNSQYGITMKMIDFNNPLVNERDSVQHAFFGAHANQHETGLLSTDLAEDGYPRTTEVANAIGNGQVVDNSGKSLAELFKEMTDVNHLFIESIYNESGYFEYDSTSNFAHLNENGDFTVYDQLAAIGTSSGPTRTHGQFMPYNQIEAGKYAGVTNQTDVLAKELADTNPRKGEKMYLIPQNEADYFFGMEMESSFTQTTSGLDEWGHDIIFEFSGDDDFWLYVDGELVLDLGGVRSALTGSVNFRTGTVVNAGKTSTLYDIFKNNYKARELSKEEINKRLGELFEAKEVDGKTVHIFRDYSNHSMKMFYMERGAGASNLHMRFNLPAVRPGTVVLSKTISGTEKTDYTLAEFPYQIFYKTKEDGETQEHQLGEKSGTGTDAGYNVTYYGKSIPVKYASSYTPAGGKQEYKDVFFLSPGQSAVIQLPENVTKYYIVECGVNPNIYDTVTANETVLTGEDSEDLNRKNYKIEEDSPESRQRVTYDNHVNPSALRTLTITKKLYAEDGTSLLNRDADRTTFNFRLYLAGENNEAALANMYPYQVKDAGGSYCRWDAAAENFASLGKNTWAQLSDDEKSAATFHTSPNGAISRIPADYSVEVRDLIVGAKFQVEERESEIPLGYQLRPSDGYTRVEGSYLTEEGESANTGIIRDNSDPAIEIHNQRGWGLSVDKLWTDADYAESHDPVYFAVYIRNNGADGEEKLTLLPDTIRQLSGKQSSVRWYFDSLEEGTSFDHYEIREVTISSESPEIKEGVVKSAGTVKPLDQGSSLSVGAVMKGEKETKDYSYYVSYTRGQAAGSDPQLQNVRTDTVTNARSGIRIIKTQWDGTTPLPGAEFTLKDQDGKLSGTGYYTSDKNGLVTIAYLADGTYTLTEEKAPDQYQGLTAPLTITVHSGKASLSGDATAACSYTEPAGTGSDIMPLITVKNRPFTLQVRKTDENDQPLPGVSFSLYRQVSDAQGHLIKDYRPCENYENLQSDEDGFLPGIDENLPAGTYYLTETKALNGYELLPEDLVFTIGKDGTVTIRTEAYKSWLAVTHDDEDGTVHNVITVLNGKRKEVQLRKIREGTSNVLEDAEFALYRNSGSDKKTRAVQDDSEAVVTGKTDARGILSLGNLVPGEYQLVELQPPPGYHQLEEPVLIQVGVDNITVSGEHVRTVMDGLENLRSLAAQEEESLETEDSSIYMITVMNTPAYVLPVTGGPGIVLLLSAGALLAVTSGVLMLLWRRKNRFRFLNRFRKHKKYR